MNDKIYPSMVIRSQAEAIELLQQENEKLQQRIDKAIKAINDNMHDDYVIYILEGGFDV